MTGRLRQLRDEWRPSAITLGAPVFPLTVLFGLNAVEELDRSAFAVLLPDIRDHFGLSDATALALVAALPDIAVFLPVLGAMSDTIGLQASMLLLVPTCVIGAVILASAAKIVDDDIANVRRGSLTAQDGPRPLSDGVATVV